MIPRGEQLNQMFITYESAQKLIERVRPFTLRSNKWNIRRDALRIISELKCARHDVDYSPLPGYQCTFSHGEFKLLATIQEAG